MATRFDDWEGQFLQHHGIKGQKWGVRRYQNEDGTLTALGKLRGGKEARQDNRILKKAIKDSNKLSKEWRKDRKAAYNRALKDDNYRKSIADLDAIRNGWDREETKEWYDAHFVGDSVANNLQWYKHGDRQHRDISTKIEKGEKIAKTIIRNLQKKGLSVSKEGKQWQRGLEIERGVKYSGKNAFKGKSARSTLALMQAQRGIERKRQKQKRKEQNKKNLEKVKTILETAYTAKKLVKG